MGLRYHIDGNQACFHNEEGARPPVHFFRATQSIVAQQHIYTRWPTASVRASIPSRRRLPRPPPGTHQHRILASAARSRFLSRDCLLRYDSLLITAQHAYYWGTIALPIVTQRKARSQRHRKAQNDYHRAPLGPIDARLVNLPGLRPPSAHGGNQSFPAGKLLHTKKFKQPCLSIFAHARLDSFWQYHQGCNNNKSLWAGMPMHTAADPPPPPIPPGDNGGMHVHPRTDTP